MNKINIIARKYYILIAYIIKLRIINLNLNLLNYNGLYNMIENTRRL